ncbi:C40 family peptidase [Nocardioides sp. WS12]|uniref:C40 family peptidase n=1 Tax=Nocardioides sp. WS12 TaxID=2486272 RepID=UPI0015FE6D93|nr:C40 family peptidase [Nocardioides sp. WS12]
MSTTLSRVSARLLVVPLAASLLVFAPSDTAHADESLAPAPVVSTSTAAEPVAAPAPVVKKKIKKKKLAVGRRALKVAKTRAGRPYVYGANGPNAFDCSGLVQWSFRKVGKKLPRTSGAQAGATRRVKNPRRGDLVFFSNGGRVYHVGIYAGNHTIWHASRPGAPVKKERIWTNSVFYGRVR